MIRLIRKSITSDIPFFLATPALLWQFFFVYCPLIVLLFLSFVEVGTVFSFRDIVFTFSHYQHLFDAAYLSTIGQSLILAFFTTTLSLVVGFPIAYYIALKARRFKNMLLFLIILPSWTSLIVQVYSWFFLLQKGGIIHVALSHIGLANPEHHLLNSTGATLVGMVYCYLPFMIFPLYTVLEKLDYKLIEASADLGANRFQTLLHVIIPMSRPGVYAGLLLVFIAAFGEFAIPELLGGSKQGLWGNVIVHAFLSENNFHTGAALTYMGVATLALLLYALSFLYSLFEHVREDSYRQQRGHETTWQGEEENHGGA